MKVLRALFKISKLYLSKRYTDLVDISNSYTKVSSGYDTCFLKEMHKYNEEMLEVLVAKANKGENVKELKVLDLACGTGFNSDFLMERLENENYTLVDISTGMLKKAKALGRENWSYIESDMLSFLKGCEDNSFDIVVCAWAIKYQNPHEIIKEVARVLKNNGHFAVIVNLKGTLPEVRQIYPSLLKEHYKNIDKIMRELPNPLSKEIFNKWFKKEGFNTLELKGGSHKFAFKSGEDLVGWVTSTGALAGFDTMVNMEEKDIQETMIKLFNKRNIDTITHKFVWGVYENEK